LYYIILYYIISYTILFFSSSYSSSVLLSSSSVQSSHLIHSILVDTYIYLFIFHPLLSFLFSSSSHLLVHSILVDTYIYLLIFSPKSEENLWLSWCDGYWCFELVCMLVLYSIYYILYYYYIIIIYYTLLLYYIITIYYYYTLLFFFCSFYSFPIFPSSSPNLLFPLLLFSHSFYTCRYLYILNYIPLPPLLPPLPPKYSPRMFYLCWMRMECLVCVCVGFV
jgi:hypothetical protein